MLERFNLRSGLRSGSNYLYELEALRGIAILLVFFFHTHGVVFGSSPQQPSVPMSFIVSGNTGVTLFFVLSGFLLSLPWLKYSLGQRVVQPDILNFYKARSLRIIPLYWVAVVISALLSANLVSGLKAAGFLFVGFDMFPYSVVWWTLATEVQFYVLMPLCFLAWDRGGIIRFLLLAAFFTWLYYYTTLIVLKQLPVNELSYGYNKSIFGRLPAFLFGVYAGWVYLKWNNVADRYKERYSFRLATTVTFIVVIYVLGLVLQVSANLTDSFAEKHWHIRHIYESALWATVLIFLVMTKPFGRALLVNRAIAITGKLSYSLYLVHVPIIFFLIYPMKESMGLEGYVDSVWLVVNPILALMLSILLSGFSYRFIELPFLNRKRRIASGDS